MSLSTGTRLGPYEIQSLLGAGGMGRVYRARDTRLNRDVAIKVLPDDVTHDPGRLRRFEQEAKAASSLRHPNILTVYDVGTHEGLPYLVTELIEGQSMREVLVSRGKISTKKALDWGAQVARGLASAHDRGLIHRDLKPENLLIGSDGRVMILDFGLAKLVEPESSSNSEAPTGTALTGAEVVLGTAGYMSPEQVRAQKLDARSDLFSLGCVLYELLGGRRAFTGRSSVEILNAILKEDPPALDNISNDIPPAVSRIVERCLAKDPSDRFQTAKDLGYALESSSGIAATSRVNAPAVVRGRGAWTGVLLLLGAVALSVVSGYSGFIQGKRSSIREAPVFTRLTFQRGNILNARFTPDGQSVVYSASWNGRPAEIFVVRIGSPESRALGIQNANVTGVSRDGQLAIVRKSEFLRTPGGTGTLAVVSMSGGTPRDIRESVHSADFLPSGELVVQSHLAHFRDAIEYPPGHQLLEYTGGGVRVSPDGKRIAVLRGDTQRINVMGLNGSIGNWGPAWSELNFQPVWRSNEELVVTGLTPGGKHGVYSVQESGPIRCLFSGDEVVPHDADSNGRLLVERGISRWGMFYRTAGQSLDRDFSWLDSSTVVDVSADGQTLLFSEIGEGGGPKGSVFIRTAAGEPATRLGEGVALALSSDQRWALVATRDEKAQIQLIPLGPGQPQVLDVPPEQIKVPVLQQARSIPGEHSFILVGIPEGRQSTVFLVGPGKPARALLKVQSQDDLAISPDGRTIACVKGDQIELVPLDGSERRVLAGIKNLQPIQWSSDGRYLFLRDKGIPVHITRYELATLKSEPWMEVAPQDPTGLILIKNVKLTRDGKTCVYSANIVEASDLFLVDGLP